MCVCVRVCIIIYFFIIIIFLHPVIRAHTHYTTYIHIPAVRVRDCSRYMRGYVRREWTEKISFFTTRYNYLAMLNNNKKKTRRGGCGTTTSITTTMMIIVLCNITRTVYYYYCVCVCIVMCAGSDKTEWEIKKKLKKMQATLPPPPTGIWVHIIYLCRYGVYSHISCILNTRFSFMAARLHGGL